MRVLLIHGFGCDARFWEPQTAALRAAGHDVSAPDLPYHGGPTEGIDKSLQGLAGFVAGLVVEQPAVLVGHSLGGMISLHVWHEHPERVAGIALIDSFPSLQLNSAYLPGMYADGMDPELRGWVEATREEIIGRMPQAVYDEIWPSVAAFDARPWLAEIRYPVLGVYGGRELYREGEEARLCGDLQLDRIAGQLTMRIVAGAGHFVNLEAPAEVSEALVEWMRGRW